jgi:hypothetical protein
MTKTYDPKPWVTRALYEGKRIPSWIAERASSQQEFDFWLHQIERHYPTLGGLR